MSYKKGPTTLEKPRPDQIEQIKRLCTEILGDEGVMFRELGYPDTRLTAAEWITVLQKRRRGVPPALGSEEDLDLKITAIKPADAPGDESMADTETEVQTKTCSTCGDTKPLDQFGKDKNAPDGKNYSCKPCVRARNKALRDKKKTSGAASPQRPPDETGTSAGDADDGSSSVRESTPPLAASPPLSSENGWAVGFEDPRLSDLREVQRLLTDVLQLETIEITLEDAAKVATGIAATFGPKGE